MNTVFVLSKEESKSLVDFCFEGLVIAQIEKSQSDNHLYDATIVGYDSTCSYIKGKEFLYAFTSCVNRVRRCLDAMNIEYTWHIDENMYTPEEDEEEFSEH